MGVLPSFKQPCASNHRSVQPVPSPVVVHSLSRFSHDALHSGLYVPQLANVMQEVSVTGEEIRISGSKAMLARFASTDPGQATPAVLSFVQEWRARRDSNSLPANARRTGRHKKLYSRRLPANRNPARPVARGKFLPP